MSKADEDAEFIGPEGPCDNPEPEDLPSYPSSLCLNCGWFIGEHETKDARQ